MFTEKFTTTSKSENVRVLYKQRLKNYPVPMIFLAHKTLNMYGYRRFFVCAPNPPYMKVLPTIGDDIGMTYITEIDTGLLL